MGMTEKIKILLVKKKMSTVKLAEQLGTTPQNLYNKFGRDNFSEKELEKIATVLNCKFDAGFILESGERI